MSGTRPASVADPPIGQFGAPDSQHQSRNSGNACTGAEGHRRTSRRPESTRTGARDKRPGADGNVVDAERRSAYPPGRSISDRSSEQPLRYAQLQTPKGGAQR